jgi:hypothetical protein
MTSRSGPLSDEYILDHCQRYRPIPLGAAQYILMKDLKPQHEHAFGNKPLKYHTQMARPKDFDTLAKAITKMSGNPMVRDELNSAYSKDLQSVPSVPSVPNSDSAQSIPTVDQQASIVRTGHILPDIFRSSLETAALTRSRTRAAAALVNLSQQPEAPASPATASGSEPSGSPLGLVDTMRGGRFPGQPSGMTREQFMLTKLFREHEASFTPNSRLFEKSTYSPPSPQEGYSSEEV